MLLWRQFGRARQEPLLQLQLRADSVRGDRPGYLVVGPVQLAHGVAGGMAVDADRDRASQRSLRGAGDEAAQRSQFARYVAGRGGQIQLALDRARKRGENPPEAATVLDLILAPLYLRAALGYRPINDDLDALVEAALRG